MSAGAKPRVESVTLSFRGHQITVTPTSVTFAKMGPRGGTGRAVQFDNASLDEVGQMIDQAKVLQQQMKTLELPVAT